MPISYGNVAGFKFANVQREYVKPDQPSAFEKLVKDIHHGTQEGYESGCRCDACIESYKKKQERQKRIKTEPQIKDGLAHCRVCGEWKPLGEFAYIGKACVLKYVCDECQPKARKSIGRRRSPWLTA